MSTYEPPGGQPPEGGPGYAQPQDPWAEYNPGLASVPTDPIPQQYDPYYGQQPDAWGAPTVQHGQPGWAPPQEPKRSVLPILLTVLAVVVLAGGGGFAAWYVANNRDTPITEPTGNPTTPGGNTTTTPENTVTTTPPVTTDPSFDPHTVAVGSCVKNLNEDPNGRVEMRVVPCGKGVWKVIKVAQGADIPENSDGKFDIDTSVEVCKGTGYSHWYGYQDSEDDNLDVFLCLKVQ